ncbi:hypothetical protein F4821DRAFT_265393 [Hypoxylon rubiginosum]|uniref:Uncharacterized protein n=1 Tax=Hypoxylon rubiginosum TaxID=110542 RepID=A0ACC0CKM4_9PEZI|nr:hypothetical protein F4821DRAFT_265393 [Hypoxylon rubiginosum]
MAIDRLLYLNGLDFKCETLTEGASLCIRDSCTLYEVQPGETCKQIISNQTFGMLELVQWNPVLESGCDNMTVMEGRTICVTPPGSDSYDVTITATFNNTWTWPAGSWVPGPTQGTPLNTTTEWVTAIPTTTMTTGEGPAPTDYFANCPLDDDVYDTGFDWEMLDDECKELLSPYCDPVLTGTPLPSTTFPSSCFFTSVADSTETAMSAVQVAMNTTATTAS